MQDKTSSHTPIPTELNIAPRGKSWLHGQLIDGEHGHPTRQSMEIAESAQPIKAPTAVAVPDAVRDAEKLLRAEAARLDRIYGAGKWYGFSAEKASHLEHLRVADALAATPAAAPVALTIPQPFGYVVTTPAGADLFYRHPADLAIHNDHRAETVYTLPAVLAAAPVVLPEPVGWRHSRTLTLHETEQEVQLADGDSHAQPLFTEQQMRAALLAGVSALAGFVPVAAYDRLQALCDSQAERILAAEDAEPVHWLAVLDPEQVPHQLKTSMHAVGFRNQRSAESWIAERLDFDGWRYRLEPLYAAPQAQAFQQRVQPWMMACFGPEISADSRERNHRFLEEALELVQSCGCTASEAHQLVEYVFGRPVGDPMQEAGGVMVTLAALCLANDLDMHACGETELARIWTKVEAIRAKQAGKPKHSPLPMHAQADARDAIRELIAKHSEELEHNAYAYFELAYTRRTGWMAWITDKPLNGGPVINPDRKVLCSGQGDTPEEACSAAIATQAAANGEQQ